MTFRFEGHGKIREIQLVDRQELLDAATAQALAGMMGAENAQDLTEEQLLAICGESLDYENYENIIDKLEEIARNQSEG